MKHIAMAVLLCWGTLACTPNDEVAKLEDYKESEAILANQLPVDGCDWHFGVDLNDEWGQFVADAESQPKVDEMIKLAQQQFGIAQVKVKMRYRLTGKEREVRCGWNSTTKMAEISIASITRL